MPFKLNKRWENRRHNLLSFVPFQNILSSIRYISLPCPLPKVLLKERGTLFSRTSFPPISQDCATNGIKTETEGHKIAAIQKYLMTVSLEDENYSQICIYDPMKNRKRIEMSLLFIERKKVTGGWWNWYAPVTLPLYQKENKAVLNFSIPHYISLYVNQGM